MANPGIAGLRAPSEIEIKNNVFSRISKAIASLWKGIRLSAFRTESTGERREASARVIVEDRNFAKMTQQEQLAVIERAANTSREALIAALRAMASANDEKDPYTRGHSERVTRFSVEIAENMGLPEDEIESVRIGALIHDIGKLTIDDRILNKPSMLTEAEYEVIKTHTLNGYEMLKHIPQLRDMISAARHHHEHLDGKGYPSGLKGDDIPQITRIVTVADCFDAMTTLRPYQEPTPVDRVLEIMREKAGIKFDAHAVEALIKAVKSGRIATRLEDKIQTKE